jgi:hypothetical protein
VAGPSDRSGLEGLPQLLDDQRKDARRKEHGNVTQVRHVKDALVSGENAWDDKVVRSSDDRYEPNP